MRQILVLPTTKAVVGAVMTNSPAEKVGLKPGDEIKKVNGEPVYHYEAITYAQTLMTNKDAKPATFTIRRGTEELEKEILAAKPLTPTNAPPLFGIVWQVETNRTLSYPTPWDQITASANQIFATISAVVSKKTDIGPQQLGGAVMIIRVYTDLFQDDDGWRLVLWFSVLLNVNLALLNLLPLPVLDGGHILLALIEAARRRPVSPRILNYIQSGFAMLLIGFMLWIAFFDTGDWIRSRRRDEAIIFAPNN
jgi:regulator of sigma E protease